MKIKIAILGSTGSIGKSLLKIISKDKKKFEIVLLTAHKDYKTLLKQSKNFNVKNIILTDFYNYKLLKKKKLKSNLKIFNSFDNFNVIFNKKIDYLMSSIVGLEGLYPTIKSIKYTKKIAIANKESIICGWDLIQKELKKYKTKFIPVDSEHFSIWYGIKNSNDKIKKIYLTASGGPFVNLSLKKFKNIRVNDALKHPNWKMGKKITVDSATMMNKVFELIEAKNIFNINYNNLEILIHPKSYIHSIIHFTNGMIKIIAHETDMKIPIANTLYNLKSKFPVRNKILNIKKLNNLKLQSVDFKRFPVVKILKKLPKKNSLFETILVSLNDALVDQFFKKKIKFIDIAKKLEILLNKKEFIKYKKHRPKNIEDIVKLSNYVRLIIKSKSI